MMNHTNDWMNGAMGAGMWIWTLIGVLLLVLLVVLTIKQCKK